MPASAKPAAKVKTVRTAKLPRVADIVIQDRLYFRIGDVAELCGLETYVLRFWETEFPQLAPKKSVTGQRLYRKHDVENALRIMRLLYEVGFTIEGARRQLKDELRPAKNQNALPFAKSRPGRNGLKEVRAGLNEILKMMEKKK